MNRAAVRAVSMTSLNRQRANLVASEYLSKEKVLTPQDVSARERIFEWDGVLRWKGGAPIGRAKVGGSIGDLLLKPQAQAQAHQATATTATTVTGAIRDGNLLSELLGAYREEKYVMWYHVKTRMAQICLKDQSSPQDQIKAWIHALWTAYRLQQDPLPVAASTGEQLRFLKEVLDDLNGSWDVMMERLGSAGWDVKVSNIETVSGVRYHLQST